MALRDESPGDVGKADAAETAALAAQIDGWDVIDDGMSKLEKHFRFETFAEALTFVNEVGGVAEEHGHHPEITFTWGAAAVRWWSHSLGGLSRNDFIMAAKTDALRG